MTPIAAPLSNAEINELGSYFAAQSSAPAGKPLAADAAAAGRGLAEKLNCMQCHGAELQGQQHIPRLAGQQAEYLRIAAARLQGRHPLRHGRQHDRGRAGADAGRHRDPRHLAQHAALSVAGRRSG